MYLLVLVGLHSMRKTFWHLIVILLLLVLLLHLGRHNGSAALIVAVYDVVAVKVVVVITKRVDQDLSHLDIWTLPHQLSYKVLRARP